MSVIALEPQNFRAMIERSVALLRDNLQRVAKRDSTEVELDVELGDPLGDAELQEVESTLGFALDPRFVALFRSVNGFRVSAGTWRTHVRSLRELLIGPPDAVLASLNESKILGGISGPEIQTRAHLLGGATDLRADYFNVVAVFANAANPDPVALMVTDHGAVAGDNRPLRARDLLWLLAIELNLATIVQDEWFEAKGFDGAHPIVELDLSSWELPSAFDDKEDYRVDVYVYLKGKLGFNGFEDRAPPIRWFQEAHAVDASAASLARALQSTAPEAVWDIDDKRAVLDVATGLDIRISFQVPKRASKKDPNEPEPPPEDFTGKRAKEVRIVWSSRATDTEVQRVRAAVAAAAS